MMSVGFEVFEVCCAFDAKLEKKLLFRCFLQAYGSVSDFFNSPGDLS